MTVFEELQERGLIAQTTDREEIKLLLDQGKATFYIGFDPTADSLHVGHFLQLIVMRHLQKAGNKPIALIGGGTTMVGDPSGRSDMRQMMTKEKIAENADKFKRQIGKFIDFSEDKAMMVNNADWLLHLNYVDFLRDIGVHFSVNRMLTAECFKTRLEKGLSFIEFNYMLMQSYDFYILHEKYGCVLQCGGDDQWSNILNGADLIRRKTGKDAYGLTFTLLLTAEGKKMGKTQSGAVWLDPEKTSPYDFFQYWRNIDDADVINCMKMLTFLSLDEIKEYAKLKDSDINRAKERLAYELTCLVHGNEEADKAQEAARALFSVGASSDNMPETRMEEADFTNGAINVIDLLVKCGLCASKGDARRLIQQGGLTVNDIKVDNFTVDYKRIDFDSGLMIKKGKKTFHKAVLS